MNKSESIAAISKAMCSVIGEITDGVRDSKGGHGKYADLPQLLQIVRPLLAKNKLCLSQHPSVEGDMVVLTSLVSHESGEWIESSLSLNIPQAGRENITQVAGSSITYARRYSLASIFCISQEDDDGNHGTLNPNNEKPNYTPKPPITPKVNAGALGFINSIVEAYQAENWETAKTILSGLDSNTKRTVWAGLSAGVQKWVKDSVAGE